MSVNFLGFVSDLYGFVSFQYDSLTSIPVHSHFSHRHHVTARMKTRSTTQCLTSSCVSGRTCGDFSQVQPCSWSVLQLSTPGKTSEFNWLSHSTKSFNVLCLSKVLWFGFPSIHRRIQRNNHWLKKNLGPIFRPSSTAMRLLYITPATNSRIALKHNCCRNVSQPRSAESQNVNIVQQPACASAHDQLPFVQDHVSVGPQFL